ncbi:hypothetical protein AB1K70_17250 [Bremerella sp. JC770]|uniref:hypothetical protein n=1 Tax=Bremerella sp. JC770 TaxID=3232137 RepID=UPI00345A43D7
MIQSSLRILLGVLFLVIIGSANLGCTTQRNPDLVIVSGEVTYDGQAVPAGVVKIEPDASQGGGGPADYAKIVKGRFETPKGVKPGAKIVSITGYDGVAEANDEEGMGFSMGAAIFSEYKTKIEVGDSDETRDFTIPK